MRNAKRILLVLTILPLVMFFLTSHSENKISDSTGTLTFSVTTANHGGEYSPKNVFAIWITTSDGAFVKSLKVMAAQRKSKLIKWLQSSGGNTVNAITGATLNSNQTHTVTWDCTNTSGQLVPDGNYKIHVEYTDNDFQGPIADFDFTKSQVPVQENPADLTYFKNISVTFSPDPNNINISVSNNLKLEALPNPFHISCNLRFFISDNSSASLKIFNSSGILVYKIENEMLSSGENNIIWKGTDNYENNLPDGMYYCILSNLHSKSSVKILLKH